MKDKLSYFICALAIIGLCFYFGKGLFRKLTVNRITSEQLKVNGGNEYQIDDGKIGTLDYMQKYLFVQPSKYDLIAFNRKASAYTESITKNLNEIVNSITATMSVLPQTGSGSTGGSMTIDYDLYRFEDDFQYYYSN